MFLEAIKDRQSSQTNSKSRFDSHKPLPYSFTSSPCYVCRVVPVNVRHKQETERPVHAYTYEDGHAQDADFPTALIKVCLISEVAAVKPQPRAHLFKNMDNEFFVASHLPITINVAFYRYLQSILLASRLEPHTFSCFTHDRFAASHSYTEL